MAKKSRRARRASGARPARISRPSRTLSEDVTPVEVDFPTEYHYVIEDLRRIAIIAAGLMVLLVVLALIIS